MTAIDDMKMTIQLKSCPFCGSDKVAVREKSWGQRYILCTGCDTEVHGHMDDDVESHWNRRYDEP